MFWVIAVVVGLIVITVATDVVTTVRDRIQVDLSPRRKLKASGKPAGNRALLFVLFPITLYILLGTLLLLLLTLIEVMTKPLRDYWAEDEQQPVEAIAWHEFNLFLTLFFPLAWPVIAVMVGWVFISALVKAILKVIFRMFEGVFSFLRRIWVGIIHALRDVLGRLVDRFRLIWETIVIGTQTIWEMIVGVTRQVLEQINASLRTIWATINDTLF